MVERARRTAPEPHDPMRFRAIPPGESDSDDEGMPVEYRNKKQMQRMEKYGKATAQQRADETSKWVNLTHCRRPCSSFIMVMITIVIMLPPLRPVVESDNTLSPLPPPSLDHAHERDCNNAATLVRCVASARRGHDHHCANAAIVVRCLAAIVV